MATKNQSPATVSEGTLPGVNAQELVEVDELCKRNKISPAVFAGVCSANGWRPGKAVSQEVFLRAVKKFACAPMGAEGEVSR